VGEIVGDGSVAKLTRLCVLVGLFVGPAGPRDESGAGRLFVRGVLRGATIDGRVIATS